MSDKYANPTKSVFPINISLSEQQYSYESEDENEQAVANPQAPTKNNQGLEQRQGTRRQQQLPVMEMQQTQNLDPMPSSRIPPPRAEGYRSSAIRESRIKDRPVGKPAGDSSLKIKIELDLEVEVDLYARVKGDVTLGLM